MSDVEVQESQKTIVAFITGLLIGGLLVWVFSSTPEEKKLEEVKDASKEVVENKDDATGDVTKEEVTTTTPVGAGAINVADQVAGNSVLLKSVELPNDAGWIVVRDYMDGNPGNILGAARYDRLEGLMPQSVQLMRETLKGSHYQVVFFTNNGDAGFSLKEDTQIEGPSTTFKAQ